ncbi:hypothetical protein B0H13DRAFT_1914515 [Mycena leptocephala]|nr:hypothetical protein B0H13DRAFT_1914515 [Mycena leptocephala]
MSAALVESVKAWFSTVSVVFAAVRSISEVPRNQWETVKNQVGDLVSAATIRHIAVVEKQLDAIEDASPEQLQETLRFLEASRTRGQLLASLLSSSAFPDLLRRILAKVMARAAVLEKQNTDGDGGELNPLTESTGFRIEAVPNR